MAQKLEQLEVWRGAQRVIQLYPADPELAACQFADTALEQGDMFGFALWQKVAKAVRHMTSGAARPAKA
jgi:hypothetical protein